jgi:putative PIN family toxin of toxin-antitoxin system
MSKPRVVVDTNSLISFYLGRNSPAHVAVKHLIQTHQHLASSETFAEFREVFLREKFSRISAPLRLGFIAEYQQFVTLIEPEIRIEVCIDPKDNKFLSLAVSGNASLILSEDKHLRQLHPFRGIDILSPADFLASQPR